jgi:hypothetical protein
MLKLHLNQLVTVVSNALQNENWKHLECNSRLQAKNEFMSIDVENLSFFLKS